MQIEIIITNTTNSPIYEQIYRQIKTQILKDELKEGEALPSMRMLAKELRISVITTKRAYEELERNGYIVTVIGKGSFVAKKNLQLQREENIKKIETLLAEAIEISLLWDIPYKELQEIMDTLHEEG